MQSVEVTAEPSWSTTFTLDELRYLSGLEHRFTVTGGPKAEHVATLAWTRDRYFRYRGGPATWECSRRRCPIWQHEHGGWIYFCHGEALYKERLNHDGNESPAQGRAYRAWINAIHAAEDAALRQAAAGVEA